MIEIEKPQIECIETPGDASYGKYVIEPLERGYGTTLGNALRRIMLSSLPGTAATSIKIAGVQHEFSTIPGVKEDVTEIVLNVKSLLTKLHCEGTKTVYIEATGPCEVTAGDIKSDGEVEVLPGDVGTVGRHADAAHRWRLAVDGVGFACEAAGHGVAGCIDDAGAAAVQRQGDIPRAAEVVDHHGIGTPIHLGDTGQAA